MNKLFHGKDSFLSLRSVKEELRNLSNSESENSTIDGDKITPETFSDILNTTSLFSKQRTLFVKRLYRNKDKKNILPMLLEYMEKGSSNTSIILWEDQKIRSTTKYYKHFQQEKSLEESPDLNKRSFLTWAQGEINDQKVNLEKDLIKILAERTNFNTETFVNEVKKLKLTGKKVFKEEDIVDSSNDNLEYDIWKLIDSINSNSDIPNRMEILERVLSQELDINYIIAMLARNLRLVVQIKDLLGQDTGSREIASLLKIPPFTVPQLKNIANEYSSEKISLLYEKLSSLDYEIKKGRIEPSLGLTLLITRF